MEEVGCGSWFWLDPDWFPHHLVRVVRVVRVSSKIRHKWSKNVKKRRSKLCQKVVKKKSKLSKNCQKVVKKFDFRKGMEDGRSRGNKNWIVWWQAATRQGEEGKVIDNIALTGMALNKESRNASRKSVLAWLE
jgi:hypothetical protein